VFPSLMATHGAGMSPGGVTRRRFGV